MQAIVRLNTGKQVYMRQALVWGSIYQSPLASPLLPSWVLLAAAEAKLDVRGDGMMARFWVNGTFETTQMSYCGSNGALERGVPKEVPGAVWIA
jgi:hypothetical protein